MSRKDMWIAFPHGGKIPAGIVGEKEVPVSAHDPVKVPAAYGDHLVHDRFAYETDAPKSKRREKKEDVDVAALEAEIAALSAKAEAADDPTEKRDLQKQVQDLQAKLNSPGA